MLRVNSTVFTSRHRLLEIVSILRKHHLAKGVDPVKFRMILEDLGPTFVKIGQIMASRQDMFSQRYCKELVKLRDNVSPMPMQTVREVIESEYKQRLEDVFDDFDEVPLGSASIAQVHRAQLKDGREIVVKVQRPGIYELMERDISLIRKAAKYLKLNEVLGSVVDLNIVLDEFWHTAQEEMDFLTEARYARRFSQLNESLNYIDAPEIATEYSTSKVLVMEYIDGIEPDDFSMLQENGYDREEIAAKLAENYIKQIVDDGFFHADPHPGNLRIRDGKIVWIDFGMMGVLNRSDKELMKGAVLAIGQKDTQQLVEVILTLGVHDDRINYTVLYDNIESFMKHYVNLDLTDINLGEAVQEIFTICHQHHISMPKGVSMLARGLVGIESTVMMIDPHISIIEIAANHVANHMAGKFDVSQELLSYSKLVYEASKNILHMPMQFSEALRMLVKGRMKVNLDIVDSSVPLNSIDHMVNKLTVGVISVGLLMASSILCTTQMTPRIFGIPALGFIGYLTAVGLGMWLFLTVLKDRKKKR